MSNTTDYARNREWARSAGIDNRPAVLPTKLADFHLGKKGQPEISSYQDGAEHAELSPRPSKPLGGILKRVLDLAVSVTALILASPLMLIVAAILWMSGGPVFFTHERIGYRGKKFGCLKFRSMVVNPEQALQAFLAANPDARSEWQQSQKLRHDPRVTLFGHALRRSSIDELPQLFNILRGDMSCVGPRPVTAAELDRYGPQSALYIQTRPGLTGLWQISGRSRLSYEDRVALDSAYITRWSLGRDILILFKTIFAVIRMDETS